MAKRSQPRTEGNPNKKRSTQWAVAEESDWHSSNYDKELGAMELDDLHLVQANKATTTDEPPPPPLNRFHKFICIFEEARSHTHTHTQMKNNNQWHLSFSCGIQNTQSQINFYFCTQPHFRRPRFQFNYCFIGKRKWKSMKIISVPCISKCGTLRPYEIHSVDNFILTFAFSILCTTHSVVCTFHIGFSWLRTSTMERTAEWHERQQILQSRWFVARVVSMAK